MSQLCLTAIVIINIFTVALSAYENGNNNNGVITNKLFAVWSNGTVPFYVNPLHFDHEQTLSILTALSMFAFKTCLKFKPVMALPESNEEVLTFVNPEGERRCNINTQGHSTFVPHILTLGYDCLKSPQIDMMIMKALGFPFEHNRVTRDMYIHVLHENIEPGAIELFTKEDILPLELRFLPYDIDSVMHFGDREYSKNGHRTIIFKEPNTQQNRVGLSKLDLKKIEIIYGPQCRIRDRQEKIELCQSYPGVARKKREADDTNIYAEERSTNNIDRRKREIDEEKSATKSLRVNPDITPPPSILEDVTKILSDLGIDQEVQEIVENVYKVSSKALKNAREKYCNNSNTKQEIPSDIKVTRNSSDILGIIEVVAEYAKGIVDLAVQNLTLFCEESESVDMYQRARGCDWSSDPRCRQTYRSTKSGPVRASTQHRPIIVQSTKHYGRDKQGQYGRSGNNTENIETKPKDARRKREIETTTQKPEVINDNKAETYEKSVTEDKNEKANGDKEQKPGENNEEAKEKQAVVEADIAAKEVEKEKKTDEQEGKIENSSDAPILRIGTRLPGIKRILFEPDRRSVPVQRRRHVDTSENEEDDVSEVIESPRKEKRNKENWKHLKDTNHKEHKMLKVKEHVRGKKKHVHVRHDIRDAKKNNLVKKKIASEVQSGSYEREDKREHAKKRDRLRQKYSEENEREREDESGDVERPKKKKVHREQMNIKLPRTVKLSKENLEFYKERLWPNGVVPYIIQEDTSYDLMDMRNRLEEVNYILKKKTCVQLKEITRREAKEYEDYLVIDNSPDYVTGRVGGKQKFGAIELYRGDQHRQHAAMMVMAMLGFYFEVSRHDRDKYVRMHPRHVRPDKLHHFEMIRSDATLPLPYDYESATHPAWQFWRQIGRTGISTVATYKEQDPDGSVMKSLGQHSQLLSDTDIVKINSVYGIECFRRPRSENKKQKSDTATELKSLEKKEGLEEKE